MIRVFASISAALLTLAFTSTAHAQTVYAATKVGNVWQYPDAAGYTANTATLIGSNSGWAGAYGTANSIEGFSINQSTGVVYAAAANGNIFQYGSMAVYNANTGALIGSNSGWAGAYLSTNGLQGLSMQSTTGTIYAVASNGNLFQYSNLVSYSANTGALIASNSGWANASGGDRIAGISVEETTGIIYAAAANGNIYQYASTADYIANHYVQVGSNTGASGAFPGSNMIADISGSFNRTPEPASLPLLGMVALPLLGMVRRRKA